MKYYLLFLTIIVVVGCNDSTDGGKTDLKDLCENYSCQNGVCEVVDNRAICVCEEGYGGPKCEYCGENYQDQDGDGICLPNCNLAQLNCDFGNCIIEDGVASCDCFEGYTGDNCDQCDQGYQDNDGDGECKESCLISVIDCGENGSCDDSEGVANCICDDGYDGVFCDIFTKSKISFKIVDIWGRDLFDDQLNSILYKIEDNEEIEIGNYTETTIDQIKLIEEGDYLLYIESENFFPVELYFSYSGENSEDSFELLSINNPEDIDQYSNLDPRYNPAARHGAVYHRFEPTELDLSWEHKVYIGVAHKWFANSGLPFSENEIELYIDGESAWYDVANQLKEAQEEVLAVTWAWKSNFELLRPEGHLYMDEVDRKDNSILNLINKEGVTSRVIVAQYWAQDSMFTEWLAADKELKELAESFEDGVEFMGQANPTDDNFRLHFPDISFKNRLMKNVENYKNIVDQTFVSEWKISNYFGDRIDEDGVPYYDVDIHLPLGLEVDIASYHQKFFVIDQEIAFVGGMNLSYEYWDTADHEVFNPKRMEFETEYEDRLAVYNREEPSEIAPYKDYMTKIRGPIVKDVYNVFRKRWNYLMDNDAEYSEYSTYVSNFKNHIPMFNGVKVQLTLTMPEPFTENSILESHISAIRQAKYYIYIEDQYFRMPYINNWIIRRMKEVPELQLIVITQPVNEWTGIGCYWTQKSYQDFMTDSEISDRVHFYQFRSFDYNERDCPSFSCLTDETVGHFVDHYLHAKMMIVDDIYMSIGSCNKNNRGFIYEGEMNVAIFDKDWVTAERKRIFQNFLRANYIDYEREDISDIIEMLQNSADQNDLVRSNWDDEDDTLDLDGTPLDNSFIPEGFLYSISFNQPEDCVIENLGPDAAK